MSDVTSSSNEAPTNLHQRLRSRIPNLLPDNPTVAAILPIYAPGGIHPNVRRITLSTGESLIAKRYLFAPLTKHESWHLPAVEKTVSDHLADLGCSVPRVLATIDDDIVVLEDKGRLTLDDAAQTLPRVKRMRIAERVVEAFAQIQNAFERADDRFEALVAPGADRESVQSAFLELRERLTTRRLQGLIEEDQESKKISGELQKLVEELADRPLSVGPIDYNARNIVLDESKKPTFIEWSKIGYDWAERRLVQYLASLGAGRVGSSPRLLIDRRIQDVFTAQTGTVDTDLKNHVRLFSALLGRINGHPTAHTDQCAT